MSIEVKQISTVFVCWFDKNKLRVVDITNDIPF